MTAVSQATDSAISYSIGGVSLLLSHYMETAQALTVVFGLVIVILRAIYDFVKVYRLLRNKPAKGD